MRENLKNKRKMFYSLQLESVPVYETDDEGNIIFAEVDGEEVPVETGDHSTVYADPVGFLANIHGAGGEAEAEAYGVSLGSYDAVLYSTVKSLPITETSLIWVDTEPQFDENEVLIPESADYKVKRVPPSLNEMVYLLERIEK
jgi:hypothetical protein